ncbi:TIGR02679 family protein [Catenulispora rubra]|uniref:TIGR02679 family protein n=1 Tax=Catenulispora rubra TaxID=280293 RepID=UPI0018924D8A|nr:TIGR02679 family protein [Catenulispora rubra]
MADDRVESATVDTARLHRLFGAPELEWLVKRVEERIAGGIPAAEGSATLAAPTPEQRRAIERLLGRPPGRGRSLTVRLSDVDSVLKDSGICPSGLAVAVQALRGPIPVRRDVESAAQTAWESAHEPLDRLVDARPELAAWLNRARAAGLLKRQATDPSTGTELARRTAQVLALLPHPGIVRPILAARAVGDAHALDDGRPLTALVMSAVRSLAGLAVADTADAEGRRHAWATVGVATDDLSSRVLVLNIPPPAEEGFLTRILTLAATAGEPLVLSLRHLAHLTDATSTASTSTHDLPGTVINVCENPAVVSAAATELGPACPPLICLEGSPSVAATRILRWLMRRGASLRYHGDFDWGGTRIAAGIFALAARTEATATPWRYDHAAYLAAVAQGLGTPLQFAEPRDTPWDPELRHHIATQALRVEEEHVIETLLSDLADQSATPSAKHIGVARANTSD